MRKSTLLFALIGLFYTAFAQQPKIPKVAFAFSGGGAKGLAHIGVLKVLEAEGIYPDYVTGTSMGSIVGGLYAIGYNSSDLEELAIRLVWEDYFNDNLDRSYLSIEEKSQADRYQVQFPIEKGKVQLPTGFVGGQKIGLLLSRLTIPAHNTRNFDDFMVPFRAIATDLATGEAVILGKGFLADAIRASMSIPTVFNPIELEGKLLADGLLIRNLPVQDAFDLGADVVIAVDVGGELYNKEEFSSVLRVLEQTGSFMGEIANEEQRALASILISPDISGTSALSFTNVDTIIARGEQAARLALPKIKYLLKDYPRRQLRTPNPLLKNINQDSFLIQGVDFDIESEKGKATLRSFFNFRLPDIVSLEELDERLKTVYSTRFFKKLDYRLLPADENGFILSIRAESQSGNFLKASANYDSDFGGGILLNATFRNKLINRSKFSVDLRVSGKPALLFEYLIYTASRPNIGIRLNGKLNFFTGLLYRDNNLSNQFDWRHSNAEINFFTGLTQKLSLSVGYGGEVISQNKRFYDPDSDEVKISQHFFQLVLNRDTYNRLHFPTDGSQVSFKGMGILNGTLQRNNIGSVKENTGFYYRAQAEASKAFKIDEQITLRWSNFAGYQFTENEASLINLFYLGRALPYEKQNVSFPGLRYMERPMDRYITSGLAIQVEPFENKFITGHFNYGYYHTPTYDFFNNGAMVDATEGEDFLAGAAVDLGMLTTLGPVFFSTQYNFELERFNFVLHLGYLF